MATPCRKFLFSGRVQGVGFRQTAVELARKFDLRGTVQNLPDGRVELILSGAVPEMEALVTKLREHFGAFVRNVEQDTTPAQPFSRGVHII